MLTKQERHEASVDAEGRVNVKRITTYLDGDTIISTTNHREVISEAQGDAAAKLQELKDKIVGELAVTQELRIQQEEAQCAAHMARIAELQDQNQALLAQIANLEAQMPAADDHA